MMQVRPAWRKEPCTVTFGSEAAWPVGWAEAPRAADPWVGLHPDHPGSFPRQARWLSDSSNSVQLCAVSQLSSNNSPFLFKLPEEVSIGAQRTSNTIDDLVSLIYAVRFGKCGTSNQEIWGDLLQPLPLNIANIVF